MGYEIVNDYDAIHKAYMADVVRENERRRGLMVRRLDPNQDAFSPHSEIIRQNQRIEAVNRQPDFQADVDPKDASQSNKTGSGYEIIDGPTQGSGGYEIVDPTPNASQPTSVSKIPQLRQGSPSDVQVRPTMREATQGDSKPEDWRRLGVTPPDDSPTLDDRLSQQPWWQAAGKAVRGALDTYEQYVAGPYRRAMFKEDPLETMAKTAPGPDASMGEIGWHLGKTLGVGILTDPLTVLGLGSTGVLMPRTPRIGGAAESHAPAPPRAPVPDIRTLAQQAQEKQLTAAQGPVGPYEGQGPRLPGEVPPAVGKHGEVLQTPTGSLARGSSEHLWTQETGHTLETTPTGSMVQLEQTPPKPSPYPGQVEGIPFPAERVFDPADKTEPPLPPSRRMHGSDLGIQEQGPPKPPLKSAEDLLAEKFARREAEAQSLISQVPKLPDHAPDLSQLLRQPAQAGPRGDAVPLPGEATRTQATVGGWRPIFQHAYDVLDNLGPYTRRLSDILRYTWDYSEQGTIQNFRDYSAVLTKYFGERGLSKRIQQALNDGDVQTLLNSSAKDWGLTQAQIDALVELHEIGGNLERASTKAVETLPLRDPKVQKLFQEGWQIATGRASSLPSVQGKAMVYDPITGERYPVGAPGPYWPHQAATTQARVELSETLFKRMYERGQYAEKGIPYQTFKDKFTEWWKSDDPDVKLRKFAGLEYKRFLDVLEDAKSHNRTVAESLRYYGYETDPLRMLVRHNLYALKRGASLEHADDIKGLMNQISVEYGPNSKSYNWVESVFNRSQGISRREDFIDKVNNPWHIAQSIAYPIFLRGSWKQNFVLQPNYAVMQTGLKPVTQALWKYFGGKLGLSEAKTLELAERSGATFPAFLTKYHQPEGLWEQYSKSALELDLFSPSDMMTRKLTGLAAGPYTESVARKFWSDPSNPQYKGLLREMHINPEELYRDLSQAPLGPDKMPILPDKYIMRGMQVKTNQSMGRTGIRSLQAWAAGDTELHHVMLMLRRQILSNEGIAIKAILDAPTAGVGIQRALKLMVGAEAAGLMYNGIVNWLVGNDFFDVNQSLVKTFGGNKEAALFAKALLMGIGTFTAGVALSGLQMAGGNYASPVYSLMSPPIASLADEAINKAVKGEIPGLVKRLLPSEIATDYLSYGEAKERRRKQGGSGLGGIRP